MGHRPAVLAVDGGNSKADLALLAADGSILAAIRRPGVSHQALGVEGAAAALRAAVDELQEAAGLAGQTPAADVAAFCLAGADFPMDDEVLDAMLARGRYAPRWILRNDVFAVLRAGTDGGAGIAVVCGAGMNGVGVARDGRSVRYPALGDLSGDWAAGGGWLGVRALGAAIRGEDGRGPATVLSELVPDHFGLTRPLAVTEAVYAGRLDPGELRGLAPIALRCAAEGDAVAGQLVAAVSDELATLVRATMDRLDLREAAVPVVLGGGMFRSADGHLRRRLAEDIAAFAPAADVRPLTVPPVLGAALLGLDLLDTDADAASRAASGLIDADLDGEGSSAVSP